MNGARREALHILMRGEISHGRPLVSNKQSQRAVELFSRNYNCAQSVYAGSVTGEGLSEAQRLALAAPFGGGVARQGEICGALTGALLALGEIEGGAMAADPVAGRNALYERARQMTEAFRKEHGVILCRELTGCALDTEAGMSSYKERGLHKNLCTRLVAFAAEEVAKMTAASARK
jgi:C_GCAxxG_C_C family probable redox protein